MNDCNTSNFSFNGKTYTLDILSGTVVQSIGSSKTHVSGYVSANKGVRINSFEEVVKDVWLKGTSGVEHHLQLGECEMRVGQSIHLASINDKKVMYANEGTGLVYEFARAANIVRRTFSYFLWILISILFEFMTLFFGATHYILTKDQMDGGYLFSLPFDHSSWYSTFDIGSGHTLFLQLGNSAPLIVGIMFSPLIAWFGAALVRDLRNKKNGEAFMRAARTAFDAALAQLNVTAVAITSQTANGDAAKFCTGCGKPFEASVKFCGQCGATVPT